ncbi:MAG TPA: 6-phospho-beta-glucosidase [Chloroflexi bacterium]|nr:6-phospho-beta-glucosidase [Chloroflexota bacterium]HBY08753.1 6-phospho-beta-glucosidase [Chloroflexota bacterium]
MKVTVIGGGSTYTPELVNGFLARHATFPVTELCLMDINAERLEIVGGFAQRMVEYKGSPFKVTLSTDQREAIRGASYVTTQLRVGMMEARKKDEYLGLRHGLIGQETTGIGGMAKAMRTIPVLLSIANDIREVAPGAPLVNFTNPAGLVTEALFRYAPDVTAVGVCNVPITTKMHMIERLEEATGKTIPPQSTQLDTLGLNHLTWHRGFTVEGEEMWPQIIEGFIAELKADEHPEWDPRMVEILRMMPNYYLQYFYYTNKKLASQKKWPPSRGEEVMEIEKGLLAQYADPELKEPPADLMKRGGAYYSTLATQLLNAHYNNLGERHIVNVRHNGAVDGWPADWVLEMPAIVDQAGFHPIEVPPLPQVCYGLIAQVKSYEILTVEAAVHGDRNAAFEALLANPLGPAADKIQEVLDDLLETHKQHLPQFS